MVDAVRRLGISACLYRAAKDLCFQHRCRFEPCPEYNIDKVMKWNKLDPNNIPTEMVLVCYGSEYHLGYFGYWEDRKTFIPYDLTYEGGIQFTLFDSNYTFCFRADIVYWFDPSMLEFPID